MNMRWISAGVAAVLITGGAATLAQRAITQKTRGVLPDGTEAAHADTRLASKPVAATSLAPTLALATPPPPGELPAIAPSPEPGPLPEMPEHVAAAPVPDGEIKLPPDAAEARPGAEMPVEAPVVAAAPAADPGAPAEAAEIVAAPTPVDPGPAASDPAVNAASTDVQATIRPEGPRRRARPGADEPAPAEATSPGEAVAAKADPVQSVEEFVERNRKEAEQAIHDLSSEAEELKARLAKVETALVRWHAFSRALKVDQPGSPTEVHEGGKTNWKKAEGAQPAKADDASPDLRPLPAPAEAPAPEPAPPAGAPEPKPAAPPAEGPAPELKPLPGPTEAPASLPSANEPPPAPAADVPSSPTLPPPAEPTVPPAEPAIPPAAQPKPAEPPPLESPTDLPRVPAEPRPGR